jgi:acetyl esterase/lipase
MLQARMNLINLNLPAIKLSAFSLLVMASANTVLGQSSKTVFDRWDKNGDGKLIREELPAHARANFERADKDGDGLITRGEDTLFRKQAAQSKRKTSPEKTGAAINIESDIAYAGTDNPRQTLNLLLPETRKTKLLPVVVFIHGGGWQNGDKRSGTRQLTRFVENGEYAGVSIGYRLTNEAHWPAQIHDCKAAIRWIRGNAGKYSLDPEHIGVFGTSAGGHLVAILGTSGGIGDLEGQLGSYKKFSSNVSCVGNFFGPSALLEMSRFPSRIDHDAAGSPESKLVGGPLQETRKVALSASPITHVSKDDPPMLSIHGTDDQLVPYNQSVILDQALRKAGCNSTFITVKGGGHGGFNSPEIDKRLTAFFSRHLLGSTLKIKGGEVESSPREPNQRKINKNR